MEITQNKFENWINKNKFTAWMKSFVNSEWFIVLIGIIVLISNCFAQELICFGLIALLSTLALIFSKDTKPLIFVLLTFQMGMSYKNGISYNPHPELPTIYDDPNVITYLSILGGIVILGVIFNFIIFKQYKNKWTHMLYLIPGLCALGTGYLLSGCINNFSVNNLIYSASNIFMILGIYVYFSLTAFNYKEQKTVEYISKVMVYTSLLIGIEVIHIYLTNGVIYQNSISKYQIYNGWGISNNFAGYYNLCVPFIVYMLLTTQKNLKYYIYLFFNCIFTVMTLSRNGYIILFIELICTIVLIFKFRKEQFKKLAIVIGSLLLIVIVIAIIYYEELYKLFIYFFEIGTSLHGRKELYEKAWQAFISNPIFGAGWFLFDMGDEFIPPTSFAPNYKAHNFILQLLGSTGIFGFICFVGLIASIFYFTLKNKDKKKILYLISVITLLSTSVLDNYFFDYGFERYFAIFLVGISIALKEDKENVKVIETKEAVVNE